MSVFTPELREKAEAIKAKYPDPRSAMLPLLYVAQSVEGYVSREGLQEVADILDIKTTEVEAVATFYTMFHMQPTGEHVIAVCTNLSCMLRGAYEIYNAAKETLGEGAEHMTADGKFTLHEEECLGACDAAPLVQVDVANHDCVSKERMLEIIEQLRKGEVPSPSRGEAPRDWKHASRMLAGLGDGP